MRTKILLLILLTVSWNFLMYGQSMNIETMLEIVEIKSFNASNGYMVKNGWNRKGELNYDTYGKGNQYIYQDNYSIQVLVFPNTGSVTYVPTDEIFNTLEKEIESKYEFYGTNNSNGIEQRMYRSAYNRIFIIYNNGKKMITVFRGTGNSSNSSKTNSSNKNQAINFKKNPSTWVAFLAVIGIIGWYTFRKKKDKKN